MNVVAADFLILEAVYLICFLLVFLGGVLVGRDIKSKQREGVKKSNTPLYIRSLITRMVWIDENRAADGTLSEFGMAIGVYREVIESLRRMSMDDLMDIRRMTPTKLWKETIVSIMREKEDGNEYLEL